MSEHDLTCVVSFWSWLRGPKLRVSSSHCDRARAHDRSPPKILACHQEIPTFFVRHSTTSILYHNSFSKPHSNTLCRLNIWYLSLPR